MQELQRQVGLQATGKLDKDTLLALDALLEKVRAPAPPVVTPPVVTPPVTPGGAVTHARFAALPEFSDVAAARRVMRAGDAGPAVRALQEALLDMGFNMMTLKNDVGVSGVDGAWGDQTTTALKNFQIHAKKKHPDVAINGRLDAPTLRALEALSPAPGKKAWDAGQPNHAPVPVWNGDASKKLRIVTVKDEHRTFLYDRSGACTGIFANAHGPAGSETDTGLKKIRTKLDENASKATGRQLWGTERAFGKRILDLSWASGQGSGEELHGSYDYRNMGKDVSHGCVRHYNEAILTMFDAVSVGEYVCIVNGVDDPMLRA